MTVQLGELLGKRAESGRDAIVGELAEVAAYDRAVALISEARESVDECKAELAEVLAAREEAQDRAHAFEDTVPMLRVERDRIRRKLQRIQTGQMKGKLTAKDLTAASEAAAEAERGLSDARRLVGAMTSQIAELQTREGRLEKLLPVLAQVEEPAAPALRAVLAMVARGA
jgi:predicted  nucleic acid-binding Zn-ribbon protein